MAFIYFEATYTDESRTPTGWAYQYSMIQTPAHEDDFSQVRWTNKWAWKEIACCYRHGLPSLAIPGPHATKAGLRQYPRPRCAMSQGRGTSALQEAHMLIHRYRRRDNHVMHVTNHLRLYKFETEPYGNEMTIDMIFPGSCHNLLPKSKQRKFTGRRDVDNMQPPATNISGM